MAHAARKPKAAYSERKKFAIEVRIFIMKRRGLDVVAGSIEVSAMSDHGMIGAEGERVRWTRPVNAGLV